MTVIPKMTTRKHRGDTVANKVLEIYWQQITQQQLPFPTSRTITTLPSGDGAIRNSGIADYLGPAFDGIYIRSNGLSGAAERWYLECTQEKAYEKFKIYVNFGSNWYVYEIQAWGPGTWVIENPSGQPRIPNQLMIGAVVNVFDDFPPGEANPLFPPPTRNPFLPDLCIDGRQDEQGNYLERAWGTLFPVPNVSIDDVFVYHNGVLTTISLLDLLAGHLFDDAGDYEIVVTYRYLDWPAEYLRRLFTVIVEPRLAFAALSAKKTAHGNQLICGQFDFGLYENGVLISTSSNRGHTS